MLDPWNIFEFEPWLKERQVVLKSRATVGVANKASNYVSKNECLMPLETHGSFVAGFFNTFMQSCILYKV